MSASTLAVVAAMHGIAGAAFLVVARVLSRRPHPEPAREAARGFIIWWTAMGAYMLVRAALTVYAASTEPAVSVFLLARGLTIPLLTVAVWGLVTHILFVYTGQGGTTRRLGYLYGGLGMAFLFAGFVPSPDSVVVERWHVHLAGEGETLLYRAVYGAFGITIIGSALAYISLARSIDDRRTRRRSLLVGTSLLFWVASGLVAFLSASDLAKFIALVVLGLLTAITVLAAYPPSTLSDLFAGREERARRRAERREALQGRAALLV